jgi:hypothetical protein
VTKKGNTIEHEGRKLVWCTKHTSKDGSINGLYMPSPHNHDEWAQAKADKAASFKKRKEEAKKTRKKPTSPPKKPKTKEAKAENMFDAIYKNATAVEEN